MRLYKKIKNRAVRKVFPLYRVGKTRLTSWNVGHYTQQTGRNLYKFKRSLL